MKKFRPSVLPGMGWLLIVTVLLTMPGSAFPQENWLSTIWFDKWVHIGLFALLVTLWCWAYSGAQRSAQTLRTVFTSISILALLYGTGMEFVQKYLVVNRSFDGADIIADGIGCVAGWIFSSWRYIKK